MSLLSPQVSAYLDRSSWIRKMFEAGAALKAEHGAEAVCDFSLGNPDLPPPAAVKKALAEIVESAENPFAFGYMPNAGYPWVQEALATHVSKEQGVAVAPEQLVLTCGAAGALNALLRAVLAPGDEVLGIAPFFVEYGFYTENHGGVFKTVNARPDTFQLDLQAIAAGLTEKTRVLLINSPNNPTGAVYPAEDLAALGELLAAKSREFGRPILLAGDEPYRFLAFGGVEVPSILPCYPYSVVLSSFSKNLSLAGERVGYVCLNPAMDAAQRSELLGGIVLANRILGFVNAPAIGQMLVGKALAAGDVGVDVSVYEARKKAMAEVLTQAGYGFAEPGGAFYFFPRVPAAYEGDDVAFCARLAEELVLAVPGRGFGAPGYFRLTFCVGEEVIRRSAEGFARAVSG